MIIRKNFEKEKEIRESLKNLIDLHKNSNDYVRNILNKMDYAINGEQNQTQKKVLANMSVENEKESARLFDLSKKLDKITDTAKGIVIHCLPLEGKGDRVSGG